MTAIGTLTVTWKRSKEHVIVNSKKKNHLQRKWIPDSFEKEITKTFGK